VRASEPSNILHFSGRKLSARVPLVQKKYGIAMPMDTLAGSASHICKQIRSNRSCFRMRLPPVRELPASNIRTFAEPVIQNLVTAETRTLDQGIHIVVVKVVLTMCGDR
jgi:hypothetical protein